MLIRIPTILRLAVFLAAFAATGAHAQDKFDPPTPKIGIVDMQAILRESLSTKSAREQIDAVARREQAVLAEEEKKLRARDQALQQERALLSPEVFAQRQQALQADIANLQRRSRSLRQALDQTLTRTMDQIQLVLFDELRKLSAELDLNLIISRSQIVIAVDAFDITKPALERLNQRLPSIEVKLQRRENAGSTNQ